MVPLYPGCIIRADMTDRNGYPKNRPAVILTPTAEIEKGSPIIIFAISSKIKHPLPSNQVPLPADPDGTVGTGLDKDSVAVCNWAETISRSDITRIVGRVPIIQLKIISHFYRNMSKILVVPNTSQSQSHI